MDWGGTQNRCQIGKGPKASIKHLPATAESRFVTHAVLCSPNKAHAYGSTGTGNLLFSYQKAGPPPRAFPGRFTTPAFPSASHRLSSPGLGQPGSYSFTRHQQSWVPARIGARKRRGSEHRRCVGRKTTPLTQSLLIHLFLLQDILLEPVGQHQRGSLASLHILSRPQGRADPSKRPASQAGQRLAQSSVLPEGLTSL